MLVAPAYVLMGWIVVEGFNSTCDARYAYEIEYFEHAGVAVVSDSEVGPYHGS